jgi:carbamoyl-phosphate synthase large subunit
VIEAGRVVAVVNTVTGDRRPLRDGFAIRRAATERRISVYTSHDTLRAALAALELEPGQVRVMTVDEYRAPSPDGGGASQLRSLSQRKSRG